MFTFLVQIKIKETKFDILKLKFVHLAQGLNLARTIPRFEIILFFYFLFYFILFYFILFFFKFVLTVCCNGKWLMVTIFWAKTTVFNFLFGPSPFRQHLWRICDWNPDKWPPSLRSEIIIIHPKINCYIRQYWIGEDR